MGVLRRKITTGVSEILRVVCLCSDVPCRPHKLVFFGGSLEGGCRSSRFKLSSSQSQSPCQVPEASSSPTHRLWSSMNCCRSSSHCWYGLPSILPIMFCWSSSTCRSYCFRRFLAHIQARTLITAIPTARPSVTPTIKGK